MILGDPGIIGTDIIHGLFMSGLLLDLLVLEVPVALLLEAALGLTSLAVSCFLGLGLDLINITLFILRSSGIPHGR